MIGPSAALVAAMLSWASAVSGLPIPPGARPPVVTVSDHAALGHYQDRDPWVGRTDTETGRITLYAGWREEDAGDRCVVAHELTHYLQVVNGLHYDPPTRAEPLAYRITARCYEGYGLPPAEIAWAWAEVRRYSR